VQTAGHVYWTWRLTRGRPGTPWRVLGSATPDLPSLGRGAVLLARGTPLEELLDAIYDRGAWRWLHLAAHSVLPPLAILTLGRHSRVGRAVASGWAGHLVVDYASHHSDAWAPLWPLSRAAWRSPVSYWEPSHHARRWSAAELAATATAALADRGTRERAAGLVVAMLAAGPLVAPRGQDLWTASGLRP
jgi:hypothetical protein